MTLSSYKAPPQVTSEQARLGWVREAIQEGETFLSSQRPFQDIDRAINLIAGISESSERLPKGMSRLSVNRIKRQVRESVATLANMRQGWNYTTDNPEFDHHTMILNKLTRGWWYGTFADRAIREALQYAGVCGTGYVSPQWDRDFWVAGRGDIKLHTYGPRDVMPIQLGRDHDLQRAYAVIVRNEVPINQAHAMFPEHADLIAPDHGHPSWWGRAATKVRKFFAPALNVSQTGSGEPAATFPTVDIYYIYVLDTETNATGRTVPMGDAGTSWYYEVPSLGSEIPTGMFDPQGRPLVRRAMHEDARLYPNRRLIIATNSTILSDGPSPYWHARVPIVPFRMDEWVWDFLGHSQVRENASIQHSNDRLLRSIDDSANARLDPPLAYDGKAVAKATMQRFNPRVPGQRLDVDLSMGKVIDTILPPQYYDVPQWMLEHISQQEERMDYLAGVRDMTALARARQIPSADSVDKMMEIAGPLPQDQSRGMERSLRDLGEMIKGLFFQFYNSRRRMQLLGIDGITPEDFDFEPNNLIPSHMPDETAAIAEGRHSRFNRIERARSHMNNFHFQIIPGSLHQITNMTRKLTLLQLQSRNFPIDWWTIADAFDIPNFGRPPAKADTVLERFKAQSVMEAEFGKQLQQIMQQPMPGQEMPPAATGEEGGGGEGHPIGAAPMGTPPGAAPPQPGAPPPGGGGNPVGRPPTGNAPPRLVTKDGGTRTTITESR